MLKNLVNVSKLVEVLRSLRNFSVTGDVEEVVVLDNLTVKEDKNIITISGLDEELEENCFIINIAEILAFEEDDFCDGKSIDLHLFNDKLILIEEF